MKTYEAVFILDERYVEDGGEAFAADVEKVIGTLGGKPVEKKSLGRKTFAREIKKKKSGIYWQFVLELAPEKVAELQERYRLNQTVMRLEVFLYEEPPANMPTMSNDDLDV
ncbi:MAG: 30S ribosomal protein S6 [Verrucomicrobiota bacterium]